LNPFAALALSALTVAAAVPAPVTPPPHAPTRVVDFAPADRYFGRMKMSFLGINNTFRDAAIMSGPHTTESGIVNKVAFADEALNDWAQRFPHDAQLARSYYLAIRAEQKLWVKEYQEKAWVYMNRIVELYPTSYFAKVIRKDIAIGFTQHYFAAPVICVPSASPAPAPTPVQRGKKLKVQVETPPCIPPPTPSPSPSPTPAATESPSPEASAGASASASATGTATPTDASAAPASPVPTPTVSPT
jgi:hypothetical protein